MSDDADRPVFTVMTSSTDKAKAYAAAWKDAAKAYRGRNADLYAENTELTRAYFACAKERDEALAAYETFRASIAKAEDGLIRERDTQIQRVERLEGALREIRATIHHEEYCPINDGVGSVRPRECQCWVSILQEEIDEALATPTEAKAPYTVCPECLDAFGVACGACLERDGSDV